MKLKSLLGNMGTGKSCSRPTTRSTTSSWTRRTAPTPYFADPMYVDGRRLQPVRGGSRQHGRRHQLPLEDGMTAEVVFYDGKAISVELPTSVGARNHLDRARRQGRHLRQVLKPAKIGTGFEVAVPLFVDQGDKIEIDTRTGEYRKRV